MKFHSGDILTLLDGSEQGFVVHISSDLATYCVLWAGNEEVFYYSSHSIEEYSVLMTDIFRGDICYGT